jgi:hypothetical protein
MSYEMISYDHHKNGIALYKYQNGDASFYKKKSFSAISNRTISKEYDGYSWFYSQLKIENEATLSKNIFYQLLMPEFPGKRIHSTSRLTGNEKYIELILELYIKIWDENSSHKVHGDFALGNFIFGDEFIYIIDWEHFHDSSDDFWGFDFIHMLFVALKVQSFRISPSTRRFLKTCYKRMCDRASDSNRIMDKPFQYSRAYMTLHSNNFGLNIPIGHKYDMANARLSDLQKLDMVIT